MRTSVPPLSPTIDLTTTASGPRAAIAPGDEVEIWCRSLGTWSSGFEAVDLDTDGWRVLRRSDGSQLPVRFSTRGVRPAATS